jgi:hypothetical protein
MGKLSGDSLAVGVELGPQGLGFLIRLEFAHPHRAITELAVKLEAGGNTAGQFELKLAGHGAPGGNALPRQPESNRGHRRACETQR